MKKIISEFTYSIQNQDKKTIYRQHLGNQILWSFKCSRKHKFDELILKIDTATSNKINSNKYIDNNVLFVHNNE